MSGDDPTIPASLVPVPDELPTVDEMREVLDGFVAHAVRVLRARRVDIPPYAAAAELHHWLAQALEDVIPLDGVQQGLLMAFEGSHPKPMNFIEREKARKALEAIANARGKMIKQTQGGVILPPGAA